MGRFLGNKRKKVRRREREEGGKTNEQESQKRKRKEEGSGTWKSSNFVTSGRSTEGILKRGGWKKKNRLERRGNRTKDKEQKNKKEKEKKKKRKRKEKENLQISIRVVKRSSASLEPISHIPLCPQTLIRTQRKKEKKSKREGEQERRRAPSGFPFHVPCEGGEKRKKKCPKKKMLFKQKVGTFE